MTHIYHWTDAETVANDPILKGKKPFLKYSIFYHLDSSDHRIVERTRL